MSWLFDDLLFGGKPKAEDFGRELAEEKERSVASVATVTINRKMTQEEQIWFPRSYEAHSIFHKQYTAKDRKRLKDSSSTQSIHLDSNIIRTVGPLNIPDHPKAVIQIIFRSPTGETIYLAPEIPKMIQHLPREYKGFFDTILHTFNSWEDAPPFTSCTYSARSQTIPKPLGWRVETYAMEPEFKIAVLVHKMAEDPPYYYISKDAVHEQGTLERTIFAIPSPPIEHVYLNRLDGRRIQAPKGYVLWHTNDEWIEEKKEPRPSEQLDEFIFIDHTGKLVAGMEVGFDWARLPKRWRKTELRRKSIKGARQGKVKRAQEATLDF